MINKLNMIAKCMIKGKSFKKSKHNCLHTVFIDKITHCTIQSPELQGKLYLNNLKQLCLRNIGTGPGEKNQ